MSLATGPRCMVASRSRPCALRLRESIRASEPAFSRARLAILSHNWRMATTSSAAEPRPTLRRLVSESSMVDFSPITSRPVASRLTCRVVVITKAWWLRLSPSRFGKWMAKSTATP
ncbi:hypothetical protein PCPL58_p4085 (plasmid) [Pseudomonas cerasi]|nr:hypothetical protein PCPL58_p4012 [Pseudomonas cerasi]CZT26346.1 hypothetical protein PCPL58_p4085 [Pseudomonas cerasi]